MCVNQPALDKRVGSGKVGSDDAVKTAAGIRAVITFQTGGFLAENQIIGNGAPQLAVGEGTAGLFRYQTLSVHGILHVEGNFVYQRQQSQLGILVTEGIQRIDSVADDSLLLLQRGLDHNGHVRQSQQLGILGKRDQRDMAHDTVGSQIIVTVENVHKEVVGIDIAAHQNVAVSAVDDIDGLLSDVMAGSHVHHSIGGLLQTQLFQQGDGAGAIAHQNWLDKAFLLGLEDAADHILAVRTGQNNTQGLFVFGEKFQNAFEIFKFHVVAFLCLK